MSPESLRRRTANGIRDRARQPVKAVVGHLGFDLLRRDYYSPVPNLEHVPPEVWSRRSSMAGVPFDTAKQEDYLKDVLGRYLREFHPPAIPDHTGSFYDNATCAAVDAELLWAMVRAHRPARVLELGAGVSTLVTAAACVLNAGEGTHTEFVTYDPYPVPYLTAGIPGLSRVEPVGASEVPLQEFAGLGAGDILFVDTTHTVKVASDVNHIILEVLPRLRPGVLVHFHDIFIPWEYPRELFEEYGFFWTEQYLLQAFLAYNPLYEVVLSAHALARESPRALKAAIPSFSGVAGPRPSAFWLERSSSTPQ